MKLLDRIKNRIINFLNPQLLSDYETLKISNKELEDKYEDLQIDYGNLLKNQNKEIEENKKKNEEIRKQAAINKSLKKNIKKTILKVLEPKLQQMELEELEYLYDKFNFENERLKEIYDEGNAFEEYEIFLSKGSIINTISQELLGNKELWKLFPEEDARGTFEGTNGYGDTEWREKYHFGKVIDIEYIKCYEFYKYEIDTENPEYIKYKRKLYQEAIPREIEAYADYILRYSPKILSNTEEYFEGLNKRYLKEKTSQKEEKIEQVEYNQVEESQDEEEM